MVGGGPKSCEGTDGVAENVEDNEQGGGRTAGIRIFL